MNLHNWLACTSMVAVLAAAGPARSTPPATDSALAGRLHEEAVNAARRGRWDRAIERWRAAEKVHAHWKYSFNLASAFTHRERWRAAWDAAQRARALGVPPQHQARLATWEQAATTALLEEHAQLTLTVEPADARVTRDGLEWDAPRRGWVTTESSLIEVSAPGFQRTALEWRHPIGTVQQRTVRLAPTPRAGTIVVRGGRPELRVLVDGRAVADPAAIEVSPGEHEVRFESPGAPSVVRAVQVEDASSVVLEAPAALEAVADPPGASLTTWGWVGLGVGVAAVATGGGLLGWSTTLADDWTGESAGHSDYDSYSAGYDAARSRYDAARVSGWVMVGVGAAALTAATVMWVLDSPDDAPAVSASVAPLVIPGGGGVVGGIGF